MGEWKAHVTKAGPEALVFETHLGTPLSPSNVLRRSPWSLEKGLSGKVVAQLMGQANVDTTLNVYTQVLDGAARLAADRIGSELFRVVQIQEGTTAPTH